jgi:hypothetical protein
MIYPEKFNHEPHKPHERKREFHANVRDVRVKLSESFRNNPENQSIICPVRVVRGPLNHVFNLIQGTIGAQYDI